MQARAGQRATLLELGLVCKRAHLAGRNPARSNRERYPLKIRVGHSPDADDAFMFYALAAGKIDTGPYDFRHELVDIETLNQRAFHGELELTALSLHAYAHLTDRYVLCTCGASMGDRYGPMLVARAPRFGSRWRRIGGRRLPCPACSPRPTSPCGCAWAWSSGRWSCRSIAFSTPWWRASTRASRSTPG